MLVPKSKVTFDRIWHLILSIDATSGVFLLNDSTKKKTFKEHIFKSTLSRLLFSFAFITISTLIVTDFELLSIILCGSAASSVLAVFGSLFFFINNKDIVKRFMKWCESLYDIKKKYHPTIHNITENQLKEIERKTVKYLTWFRIIYYVDVIGCTLGIAIIGLFLPENIYPKFSSPLPFYLPFKNQNTWMAFGTTTLLETLIIVDIATITIFMYGVCFTISIHILGYMDIIKKAAEKMKQDVFLNTRKLKSTLNTSSSHLDNNSKRTQNNTISFDEWIKIINEMINDVNSVIKDVAKISTYPILFNELAGLGSLFICGLLFTVVRKQYAFAIGVTVVCFLLLIFCYINEKIIEKFDDINNALYDIPWYNLTPVQIKSLKMLMHCDKVQKGFTAAKIHNMTIERFGIIVKAGYTNLLVLKDLVQN